MQSTYLKPRTQSFFSVSTL